MRTKTYSCGCINELLECGSQRSVSKCSSHRAMQREVGTLGEDYYKHIDALDAQGEPRCDRYGDELAETIGGFKQRKIYAGLALEVGCGASPYVRAIRDAGYRYIGIDPSPFAANFVSRKYGDGVTAFAEKIETFNPTYLFDLILVAHSLEHMEQAPQALQKVSQLLAPGGLLYLIIPDNTDPLNPDHLWFFSEDSLRYHLGQAGFVIDRFEVRKRIERENFIYVLARKPS